MFKGPGLVHTYYFWPSSLPLVSYRDDLQNRSSSRTFIYIKMDTGKGESLFSGLGDPFLSFEKMGLLCLLPDVTPFLFVSPLLQGGGDPYIVFVKDPGLVLKIVTLFRCWTLNPSVSDGLRPVWFSSLLWRWGFLTLPLCTLDLYPRIIISFLVPILPINQSTKDSTSKFWIQLLLVTSSGRPFGHT